MTYASINTRNIVLISDDKRVRLEYKMMANQDGYGQMASYKGSSISITAKVDGKFTKRVGEYSIDDVTRYTGYNKASFFYFALISNMFNNALIGVDTEKYTKQWYKDYSKGFVEYRIKEFMRDTNCTYEEAKEFMFN